ncbi:MAG TPA: hypothetical protein VGQ67_13345, partial [Candidatus Polarisedimenticolia bacterium]|nr:hypothetical protein [Candidatus Polarisedimenticolia bacterium]
MIWLRRLLKAFFALAGLLLFGLGVLIVGFAVQARVRLPALRPWHRVVLREEFHAGRAGAAASFDDYLRLEARL